MRALHSFLTSGYFAHYCENLFFMLSLHLIHLYYDEAVVFYLPYMHRVTVFDPVGMFP